MKIIKYQADEKKLREIKVRNIIGGGDPVTLAGPRALQ